MTNLTDDERREILDELLTRSVDGVLPRGLQAQLARKWCRGTSTISALWASYNSAKALGDVQGSWRSQISSKRGRKQMDRVVLRSKLRAVPIEKRQVIRQAAEHAAVTRYAVEVLLREETVSRLSKRIKPSLTAENKLKRLEHVLSHVDEHTMRFAPMLDVINVDEKWFNGDQNKRSYIAFQDEMLPPRNRQSKKHIPKTMFLAAVARPRSDPHRKGTWDGKLGIWAFTEGYTAKRSSKKHKRSDVYLRNMDTIDRTIKAQWPLGERRQPIRIQQDNAKPHISPFDPEILEAGCADGWNIRLAFQPQNSPDMNVLDLGVIASLQSLQYWYKMAGVEEIVAAVEAGYKEMSAETLNDIFLSLQNCMRCPRSYGGNDYKLPHMGKSKLKRERNLPLSLTCDDASHARALDILRGAKRSSIACLGPTDELPKF